MTDHELVDLSDELCLTMDEAHAMIGKTVARISGWEYGIKIYFTDGTRLEVEGHTYGDCALYAGLEETNG